MAGRIVELFCDDDMARLARQIKRWRTALAIVAAAGLAACVTMAAVTRTGNASQMELAVIAVSTVTGWLVLYGAIFVVAVRRREMAHGAMLRGEERERTAGTVTVTDERFTIRKSVAVRRVEVRDGDQTHRFLVCDSRAAALATAGASAVYTAHGYVAAYEVAR